MKFGEECKRSVNPYAVIEKVAEVTREKPKSATGNNRTFFTIEVGSKQQAKKLQDIESVEEFQGTVMLHSRFNYSRGIIYIHGLMSTTQKSSKTTSNNDTASLTSNQQTLSRQGPPK